MIKRRRWQAKRWLRKRALREASADEMILWQTLNAQAGELLQGGLQIPNLEEDMVNPFAFFPEEFLLNGRSAWRGRIAKSF